MDKLLGDAVKLVAIIGPTASGKSAAAMAIAKECDGEIICADSRTIYRGMDIGTAKPTKYEQSLIKHHLLDELEPDQPFSAADFQSRAKAAIADINSRQKLAIMVGGSGLYVDSILFDYDFTTAPADRTKYEHMSLSHMQALADEMQLNVSEQTYKNRRHLSSALARGVHGAATKRASAIAGCLVVGIMPPRDVLEQRIKSRVHEMLSNGLALEATRLIAHYGSAEALSAIGYQEFYDYVEGEINLDTVQDNIVRHSLQYAKRQRTWFVRNQFAHWFIDAETAASFAVQSLSGLNTSA